MVSDLLKIYVGPRTGDRILGGEIERGKGNAIYAAILLADLQNFTGPNERYPPSEIVKWLNEHIEAIGAAVEAEGGEILKLVGDRLLAIFPVGAGQNAPSFACRDALKAAQNALETTNALNLPRISGPALQIGVDLVLHLGEVYYGNIGVAQRLDFTVIGRVVNEAFRLEALCGKLERRLLLSSSFAGQCDATERFGTFRLKGVSEPHDAYGIVGGARTGPAYAVYGRNFPRFHTAPRVFGCVGKSAPTPIANRLAAFATMVARHANAVPGPRR
jgi:adenylate cyclase